MLGSQDSRWANESLNVLLKCALVLHLLSYFLLFMRYSAAKLLVLLFWSGVVELVFAGLLLLFFIESAMNCAFGGSQLDNCDAEKLFFLSLAGFLAALFLYIKYWPQIITLACTTICVVFVFGGFYIAAPLKAELNTTDLAKTCFFQFPTFDRRFEVTRITSTDQPHLSWTIGEHSPRIFKREDEVVHVWRYSLRKFEVLRHKTNQPRVNMKAICSG